MPSTMSTIWAIKGKIIASLFLVLFLALNWLWMDFRDFMTEPLDLSRYQHRLVIAKGTSINRLAMRLAKDQVISKPAYLKLLAYIYPEYQKLKTGEYALEQSLTVIEFLKLLTSGKVIQYSFTIIEGQTIYQVLNHLTESENLKRITSDAMTTFAKVVSKQQNLAHGRFSEQLFSSLEGWLLPETYYYSLGDSASSILQRAYQSMQQKLAGEWQTRSLGLPYKNAYEALIMASIIEKETGIAHERARIAGVFVRRLEKGMRLQTDPTVIYGIGPSFNGNITKKDLKRLTPYNTYLLKGLPPTPIAMPSLASIQAALHPAQEKVLYFVADGSGGHYFSESLGEHLKAVRRMIIASRMKKKAGG